MLGIVVFVCQFKAVSGEVYVRGAGAPNTFLFELIAYYLHLLLIGKGIQERLHLATHLFAILRRMPT